MTQKKDLIQVAYTNSKCSDVLVPFVNQNRLNTKLPLFLISDYTPNNVNVNGLFTYLNDEPYYKVWSNALKEFNSKYFIYLQEDFILYDKVNEDKILEYVSFLEKNDEYSFVRLLKPDSLGNKQISKTLFEIESSNRNIFSMQATIWKTNDYVKLMNLVQDKKWLENENYRSKMIEYNMKGACHYDNERKIGRAHYDSNVYPYIATAIVRGQWNFREYKEILNPILEINNINPHIRGLFLI